jgi:Domain of unknown function (DUF4124)
LLAAVLTLGVMTAARAEVFRWRDAEGGVHFGDELPPNARAEPLQVRPQASKLTPEQAAQEVQRLRNVAEARRAAEQAKKTQTSAEANKALLERAARVNRCEQAKWALAALESGRPVYRDEQGMLRIKRPPGQGDAYEGKREYLEESVRNAEITRHRQLLTKDCDGLPSAADRRETDDAIRMAEHCEQAAADLRVLSQPGAGASPELLAARRAFLSTNCAPR